MNEPKIKIRWICVYDSLPENGECVLVVENNKFFEANFIDSEVGKRFVPVKDQERFCFPTHWIPSPEYVDE